MSHFICLNCHECGRPLKMCLDGEEWCHRCQTYRRYNSHGFARGVGEESACFPSLEHLIAFRAFIRHRKYGQTEVQEGG